MTTWITSDTHFWHTKVLDYCPNTRPFDDAAAMNEALIDNWNSLIKPKDTVYHLGDVAFHKSADAVADLLNHLHGRKILICGNHDFKLKKTGCLS